jgi:4a-hydroxytetrahydrobiopterin dehydratase
MIMMNVQEMSARHCKPCHGGMQPMDQQQVREMLGQLSEWEQQGGQIRKTYKFKNFHETMAFVNAVAWIAHQEDHHPEMEVSYSKCAVCYSTHAIGGLSENDFICAAKVESLYSG